MDAGASRTASRLSSAVYVFWTFAKILLLLLKSISQAFPLSQIRGKITSHLPLSSQLANSLITVSHANSEKKCLLRQLSRIRFQWLLQMLGRSRTPGRAIESFVAVKNDRRLDLLLRSLPQ